MKILKHEKSGKPIVLV